jgi:uncharacterized protein YecT (DUF1311 family)
MRRTISIAVLVALYAGIACAQRADSGLQVRQPRRPSIACKSAKIPSARLICADADLTALVSVLALAITDAKNAASSPEEQKSLASEQQAWVWDRDRKCGLIPKVNPSRDKLQAAKKCMIDMIEARIADLQDKPDPDSTSSLPQAGPAIVVTPLVQAPALGETGQRAHEPSIQDLHFSATAEAVSGTIKCSVLPSQQGLESLNNTPLAGSRVVTIAFDDEVHSYRLFEDDAWSPILNSARAAAFAACANATKSSQLTNAGNEPASAMPEAVVAYSPQGLFVAYSLGKDTPWILKTNLPQARKKVKADLGIESWTTPSQLIRNPYFYKDVVVGMIVQFRRMVSGNEAIFDRSGTKVFVSAVPANLFQSGELVVLAGRVLGNKGLVSPNGSEELLPALNYVATFKCGGASCEGL